jgi:hypothetical protein
MSIHVEEPRGVTTSSDLLLIKYCCHQVYLQQIGVFFEISICLVRNSCNGILLQDCETLFYIALRCQDNHTNFSKAFFL